MSDRRDTGIVYTEHADLRVPPLLSLWSYETEARGPHRPPVERNRDGNHRYWLERSDPLLNTFLPGVTLSVVVNFGDPWAVGQSLATSSLLPRCAVIGPMTQPRIVDVGTSVNAIGAVLSATHANDVFGIPPSALVDEIVPLEDVWGRGEVERLLESLASLPLRKRVATLSHPLEARTGRADVAEPLGYAASRVITSRRGRVSIEAMADDCGVTRQRFARAFSTATGVAPKLFARIARFQAVVNTLLATDVSEWTAVAPALGFYDQAHMINEFREFAGSSPTVFFQPRGGNGSAVRLRGRPHEWRSDS